MEVKFQLISDLPTCHSVDEVFSHPLLNLNNRRYRVTFKLLLDFARVWELHPERLELFTVNVTKWTELERGVNNGLPKRPKPKIK
jgi:hypothetical protein